MRIVADFRAFWFLQFADFATTLFALMVMPVGQFYEANAIMRFFMVNTNPVVGIILAKFLVITSILLIYSSGIFIIKFHRMIRNINIFFIGLVLWNMLVITRPAFFIYLLTLAGI